MDVLYTSKEYVEGIKIGGGLAFIIPIDDASHAKEYIDTIDRLILVGGQDVAPHFYQQEATPLLGETNEARECFELALIHEAMKQRKHISGIFRGTELINIACGGTVYQDLSLIQTVTLTHVQEQSRAQPNHSIHVKNKSWLATFLPVNYEVNSADHQAIDHLPPGFKISARATDGVIEGIEGIEAIDTNQEIYGIQWHPELTREKITEEQAIFNRFIQG